MMKLLFSLLMIAVPQAALSRLEVQTGGNGERRLNLLTNSLLEDLDHYLETKVDDDNSSSSQRQLQLRSSSGSSNKKTTAAAAAAAAAAEEENHHSSSSSSSSSRHLWEKTTKPTTPVPVPELTPPPFEPDECYLLQYLAVTKEVLEFSKENAVGTTFWFPVYHPLKLEPVGIYTEESTITHFEECVTSGAYLLDWNEESESYDSIISTSSTCTSTYASVTGGAGFYQCATGFQSFAEWPDSKHFVLMNLYLCDTPCILPEFVIELGRKYDGP